MNNTIQTVWIIDNDEIYKYAFRKFVKMKGLCSDIVDFGNGKDAIDFLTDQTSGDKLPDVIFLDIDMPVMDGWEFVKAFEHIKPRLPKRIPIFMVTSSIDYADIVKVQNHSAITDYIIKPVNAQQFSFIFSVGLSKQSA